MVLDVLCVSGVVRGLWMVLNWVYQCVYFGVRLWLVFVLHAFCVGAFVEMVSGSVDGVGVLDTLVDNGMLGLGMALGLLLVGYLGIQGYVYVSFSLSFSFFCLLGYFRSVGGSVVSGLAGLSVGGVVVYDSQVCLVSVSLVDVVGSNGWMLGVLYVLYMLVGCRSLVGVWCDGGCVGTGSSVGV